MKKTVNYKVRAESTAKNNENNYTYIEFWAEDMNEKALKDFYDYLNRGEKQNVGT